MYHISKDPADSEECSVVCMQAPSQDFVQKGTSLERAQGSPYQKFKNSLHLAHFFKNPAILFYFLQLFYFTSALPSGGGTFHPLWLRPCSWAYQVWGNSLRNDTGAKYRIRHIDNGSGKNAGLV